MECSFLILFFLLFGRKDRGTAAAALSECPLLADGVRPRSRQQADLRRDVPAGQR